VPKRSQAPPEWPSAASANSSPASAARADSQARAQSALAGIVAPVRQTALGQPVEQPRALGLVDRLVGLARGERAAQQVGGLLVGQPLERLVGGRTA
jgi:hypothetical protein